MGICRENQLLEIATVAEALHAPRSAASPFGNGPKINFALFVSTQSLLPQRTAIKPSM